MPTIDQTELAGILAVHQKWRNGEPGGERANLYGANLHGANLYGANLHGADLRDADLYGANLRDADLRGANLYGADLYDANLRGANLCGANLYGAKFAGCNLDSVSGIVWAAVGPTPEGRTVIAVWHGPDEGVIVHCGCGRNTPADALAACDNTSDPKRCRKLVKRVVEDVTTWLDSIEVQS